MTSSSNLLFVSPIAVGHSSFCITPFALPVHVNYTSRNGPAHFIIAQSVLTSEPQQKHRQQTHHQQQQQQHDNQAQALVKATQYVPLHVHSDFSLLDGASQLTSLVEKAEELGVPALALTDHGVLYGAVQLVRLCSDKNVKPIIGNEMYLVNHELSEDRDNSLKIKKYHLIVLAKNTTGYRNLVKLTTLAHLEGKVGKGIFSRPCINKAQLYKHREGLIVSSACLGGEIPQAILNNDIQSAYTVAKWYSDVFKDDFYLEIQDHGSKEDKIVNPVIMDISKQLNIQVIATNDSHFTNCLDADAHDAMICIQTGKKLTDENRLHYSGHEYFKSIDEMRALFTDHLLMEDIDNALNNTLGVADKIETYDLFGSTRIPDFPIPSDFKHHHSHDIYLQHVSKLGLHDRLEQRLSSGLIDVTNETPDDIRVKYESRLTEELEIICEMGFSSYFLVVWDYIKHAREIDIPVGPGRGSAAGSLVAFSLRITDVDPIAFNLLFERFLNPERKSMPDIDTDFSVEGREKVISYVSKRYGQDKVAQIITFNRLTSKAVLKDVARVHEISYSEADKLAKLIPVVRGKPATLTQLLSHEKNSMNTHFKSLVSKNPSYDNWINKAKVIEGANKTFGIHAAGIVISSDPLTEIVPLSVAKHGEIITQYSMEDVEALGLLKMDFLGLKNLSVIELTLNFIRENRQEDLNFSVDSLPLDDENTYNLLSNGELDGIFQLDASSGMRAIVRELKPSNLDDISSVLALYRPGPLDAGLIPKFIRRKHGREEIEYEHEKLKPILKDTYGIMVYQEQIMRIARDLAGYTLGQADILRRAMGKKKIKDMEKEKPKFIDGCLKHSNISANLSTHLFDQMLKFAEYCFNKSHSTAYAYLTYQTAYLKANYSVEFYTALLKCNMNQSDKLIRYISDANHFNIQILPPSVNNSKLGFSIHKNQILFGLEAVQNIGESVAKSLIQERTENGQFSSIIDLIERVDMKVLNKRAMSSLIQAGAFDELHPNRKVLSNYLEGMLQFRRKLRDKKRRRETKLAKSNLTADEITNELAILKEEDLILWEEMKAQLEEDCTQLEGFSDLERLAGEKATIGYYASGHPLYEVQHVAKMLSCTSISSITGDASGNPNEDTSLLEHHDRIDLVQDGTDVMVMSCVTELKKLTTARGKKMAKWMMEDTSGRMSAIIFPENYDLVEQVVQQQKDDNEDNNDKEGEKEQKVKYVIEEDARVIVWGRVDRESSGSSQIIVDDVQRVEDVTVLMATSNLNELYSVSFQAHQLQYAAARLLDIPIDDDQASLTFIDPNGTRRRRRRKAVKLDEKNRVPFIMECMSEDGSKVLEYKNIGNNVRFPVNCAEYIPSLKSSTDCKIRLVSVGSDLMGNTNETDDESKIDLEEAATQPLPLTSSSAPSSETTLESVEPSISKTSSLLSIQSSTAILDEPSFSDPKVVNEVTNTEKGNELSEKDQQRFADEALKILNVSEEEIHRLTDSLNEETKEKPLHEIEFDDDEKLQLSQQINTTMYEAQRDPTMTQFFSRTHNISRFPKHSAFLTDATELDVELEQQGQTASKKTVSAVITAPPPTPSPASVSLGLVETRTSTSESNDNQAIRPKEGNNHNDGGNVHAGLPRRNRTEDENGNISSFTNDIDDLGQTGDNLTSLDVEFQERIEANDIADVNADIVDVNADIVDVEAEIKNVTDSTQQETPIISSSESSKGATLVKKRERLPSTTPEPNTVTESISAPFMDLSEGIIIKYDEVQLSGLLDAIVLVSNDISKRYDNERSYFVSGICGLQMDKLIEDGISLSVTGSIAFANSDDTYIIVEVRETEASGKRRRIRSFGPVAVIMSSYPTSSPLSVEKVEVETKKAKKKIETLIQKVEQCQSSIQVELKEMTNAETEENKKRNQKKKKEIQRVKREDTEFINILDKNDDVGRTLEFGDGGEILSYMSRAAEVCARQIVRNGNEDAVAITDKALISSLEWMHITKPAEDDKLDEEIEQIRLKTELIGMSFDVMKIQVEADVITSSPTTNTLTLTAQFAAKCSSTMKKRIIVVDENSHDGDTIDKMRRDNLVGKKQEMCFLLDGVLRSFADVLK